MKQIETPRSTDPIMRRPLSADREEKRVTHGAVREKCRSTLTSTTPIREYAQESIKVVAGARNVPRLPHQKKICQYNIYCATIYLSSARGAGPGRAWEGLDKGLERPEKGLRRA